MILFCEYSIINKMAENIQWSKINNLNVSVLCKRIGVNTVQNFRNKHNVIEF
jgi:hypothetical protein